MNQFFQPNTSSGNFYEWIRHKFPNSQILGQLMGPKYIFFCGCEGMVFIAIDTNSISLFKR